MKKLLTLVLGAVVIVTVWYWQQQEPPDNWTPSVSSESTVGEFDKTFWKSARPDFEWNFPRDLAAHPNYKIEWWYYTGNLTTTNGRRFGYELTFFRTGIVAEPRTESRWAIRDIYMAHFAVSDLDDKRFYFSERVNRHGIGWAGASVEEYKVWNEDWQAGGDLAQQQIQAKTAECAIDLTLRPLKDLVLQGDNGFSRKGKSQDNASQYYSFTCLETKGSLRVGEETFDVSGLSWMDREFSSSFLEKEQRGWDWFAIQLDDGSDLMLYQMRRNDGGIDEHSHGLFVSPAGETVVLAIRDYELSPTEHWQSPHSGGRYPIAWDVTIPRLGLSLQLRAAFADQELRTPNSTDVTYYEGAILVTGAAAGKPITGRGYQELTGYAHRAAAD